jgi:hypothetical protein
MLQVAEVCANDMEWKSLCAAIACPPIDEDCVPGPFVDHPTLPAACLMYEYTGPRQSGATASVKTGMLTTVVTVAVLVVVLMVSSGAL